MMYILCSRSIELNLTKPSLPESTTIAHNVSRIVQVPAQSVELTDEVPVVDIQKPAPSRRVVIDESSALPPGKQSSDRDVRFVITDHPTPAKPYQTGLYSAVPPTYHPKQTKKFANPIRKPSMPKQLSDKRIVVLNKTGNPVGLNNKGKTCYLNSLLQALLDLEVFWQHRAENLQSPSLVRSLLNTFSAMKQVNEGRRITVGKRDHVGVDTEDLLRRIQIAKSDAGDKEFRWMKQNDPAEVLGTLIEGIQNVFPNWRVCPIGLRSYDTCGKCSIERRAGRESKPYLVLNPKSDLDGSLEDFMAPEPLNDRICVACDSSQISRRVLVKSAPEVLVIQLNRVLPDGTKDSTVVDFPSVLSLPCRKHGQVQPVAYDLHSVICHQGNSSVRGHYFTYANRDGKWYLFNDEKVTAIPPNLVESSISTKQAYMYVFEKLGSFEPRL